MLLLDKTYNKLSIKQCYYLRTTTYKDSLNIYY